MRYFTKDQGSLNFVTQKPNIVKQNYTPSF